MFSNGKLEFAICNLHQFICKLANRSVGCVGFKNEQQEDNSCSTDAPDTVTIQWICIWELNIFRVPRKETAPKYTISTKLFEAFSSLTVSRILILGPKVYFLWFASKTKFMSLSVVQASKQASKKKQMILKLVVSQNEKSVTLCHRESLVGQLFRISRTYHMIDKCIACSVSK